MSNMESHWLYAQELLPNLLATGALTELPDGHRAKRCGYTHRLDYAKCDKDLWEEQLQQTLEKGVLDFSKQKPDGHYGVRRDYTPEEIADLGWYPVRFGEPFEAYWECKWRSNDDPAIYISRALPNQNMILTAYFEDSYDYGFYIRNGEVSMDKPRIPCVFTPEAALENAVAALKANGLEGFVDEMLNRYHSVYGATPNQQRMCVILDYVDFEIEPKEYDEPDSDDIEFVVPAGDEPPLQSDPTLPF